MKIVLLFLLLQVFGLPGFDQYEQSYIDRMEKVSPPEKYTTAEVIDDNGKEMSIWIAGVEVFSQTGTIKQRDYFFMIMWNNGARTFNDLKEFLNLPNKEDENLSLDKK